MNDRIALPLHNVSIDRDSEVIPVQVPQHEIALLRAVHGADRVRDNGRSDDEIELSANADDEWGRLQRKYRRVNAPDMVPAAFRTGPGELVAHGFNLDRRGGNVAPQAGIRTHKQLVAEKTKKAA